ncbi:MAG: hypothetical protein ACXVAY_11610 [Mucilaginibacter sp.]
MKKAFFIFLIISLWAIGVQAQQLVLFKPVYLPQTKYIDTRDMKMVMTLGRDSLAADPIAMNMEMNTTNVIAMGQSTNNVIPVTINTHANSVKATMNGQDVPTLEMPKTDMVIYGKYKGGNALQIDSLAGQKMNDSVRAAVLKLVEGIQNMVAFPVTPLKVGDTFSCDSPFTLPMMGIGNRGDIKMRMTYKLISIANNTAVFDIAENIDVNMNQVIQNQHLKMTMTGLGAGTMSYNVTKQYLATMINTLSVSFDMEVAGVHMSGKSTVVTNDRVEIAAN